MKRKKVVVVDDEPAILEVIRLILENAGYEVTVSQDGNVEGLIDAVEGPAVILLDVLLNGKDGRDIARHLKENPASKNIPIILISAHASAASSLKECKADDFLAKPFDMQQLLSKVALYAN